VTTYVYLAVAIVAVALIALGLVVVVRGRGSAPPAPPQTGPKEPTIGVEAEPPRPADPHSATDVLTPEDVLEPAVTATEVERPQPVAARLRLLRDRLSRSQSTFGRGLLALLSRDRLDEETWQDIEDTLIGADVGVAPTMQLVERLRSRVRVESATGAQAQQLLREELVALVDPTMDRSLRARRSEGKPGVVMVVGVNGVGKTTTVGKIARVLVADDKDLLLGAADTFRAAAADQLETWGTRVGVSTVRGAEGADPASVAFEAVREGVEQEVDAVLVDTAGRLHTKAGLMDELGKVKRVIERQAPVTEVLLVIDATTGQNGLTQARIFAEVVDVSGIVLTKLDGTAKGGIVVAVQQELGVPVKLVGLGEGPDDLAPFEAEAFVDALLGNGAGAPAR